MRKQRMWNKRMWPSHVFTSFARSSINTFVSEALDLEKKQNTKHSLGRRNSWNDVQTASPQCTWGNKKREKYAFLTQRGNKQSTVALFHTLPLALGIADPCKDAPAVPQHPPPVALPTPHHAGHTLPMASVTCQAVPWLGTQHCWMWASAQPSPQNSTKPLQDPEECSCSISQASPGICLAHLHSLHGLRYQWAWLEGIPPGFGSHSLCITFFSL